MPSLDVIPADPGLITAAYVEGVVNALLQRTNGMLLTAIAADRVTEETIEIAEATNTPDGARRVQRALTDAGTADFETYIENPTGLTASRITVLERTETCIDAELSIDRSGVLREPTPLPEGVRQFVILRAGTNDQISTGLNPTAWVLDRFPVTRDGTVAAFDCEDS